VEKVSIGVATAALNQPGDEGWAYGRRSANWQRLTRIFAVFGGRGRRGFCEAGFVERQRGFDQTSGSGRFVSALTYYDTCIFR
jgi:hypothetical protein